MGWENVIIAKNFIIVLTNLNIIDKPAYAFTADLTLTLGDHVFSKLK